VAQACGGNQGARVTSAGIVANEDLKRRMRRGTRTAEAEGEAVAQRHHMGQTMHAHARREGQFAFGNWRRGSRDPIPSSIAAVSYRVEMVYIVHNTSSSCPTCAQFFHHLNPTDPYPACRSLDDESKLQFTCVCVSGAHRPRSSRSCTSSAGASGKRGEISHSNGTGHLKTQKSAST
jgi:hypothetical protein